MSDFNEVDLLNVFELSWVIDKAETLADLLSCGNASALAHYVKRHYDKESDVDHLVRFILVIADILDDNEVNFNYGMSAGCGTSAVIRAGFDSANVTSDDVRHSASVVASTFPVTHATPFLR